MTTYAAFVNGLEALTITGVTRMYTSGSPSSLNTADLPAGWVDVPKGEADVADAGDGIVRTVTANLVIALEPVGQNTRPANFDATVTMLDNIHTALAAWNDPLGSKRWASSLMLVTQNDTTYWAVVTEVSGLG